MLLAVEIVPNPVAIEPAVRMPVLVMLLCTADGRVWLKTGTLPLPVISTLFAAEPVTWIGLVPFPNRIPLVVKLVAPVPPFGTDWVPVNNGPFRSTVPLLRTPVALD